MFDEDELRRMSPGDRARLMRTLAVLDMPRLSSPGSTRRRKLFLLGTIVCCVVLAVWIGVLAVTLPRYYRAGGWRGAWVGFDLAELVAFAATAWAAWRGRQVLIICLTVLATLLLCDAWFDVTLNVRTSGFQVSLLSALLIEIPLAVIAILGARRLLRLTIARIRNREGLVGPVPSLWKIPLFGPDEGGLRRDPARPASASSPAPSASAPSPVPSVPHPSPVPLVPPPSPPPGLADEARGERGSTARR